MQEYIITGNVYTNGSSDTIVIRVKASSRNDAFIIGASKFYSMYAGTDAEIFAIGVTEAPSGE